MIASRYDRRTSASTPSMSKSSASGPGPSPAPRAATHPSARSTRRNSPSSRGTVMRTYSGRCGKYLTRTPCAAIPRWIQRASWNDEKTKLVCDGCGVPPAPRMTSASQSRRSRTYSTNSRISSTPLRSRSIAIAIDGPVSAYGPPKPRSASIRAFGPTANPTRSPASPHDFDIVRIITTLGTSSSAAVWSSSANSAYAESTSSTTSGGSAPASRRSASVEKARPVGLSGVSTATTPVRSFTSARMSSCGSVPHSYSIGTRLPRAMRAHAGIISKVGVGKTIS